MRKCKLFVRKRLTAGVLAVAMAFAIAPGYNAKEARADQTIEEIQREKEKTEEKKKEAQSKLDDLNVKKDDIVEVIQELDNQIAEYEAKIEELTQQRNAIQAGVSITEDKLQNAYIAEANQYRNMKERIQYAYENGDTAYIDALMSVGNYDDIINQSEYVGQVSAYDQKELQKLAEIEASIAQYEEELGTKLDNVNELKSEAEGEQAALEVVQEGKKEKLGEYDAAISLTEDEFSDLDA
jgi:peptidoglycan hydrolase CwlO-like protein